MSRSASGTVALFLCRRSLVRGNRGILLATIAMLVLVYLNMLFLPSLIEGASEHLSRRLRETTTADLAITPATRRDGIEDAGSYLRKLEAQPGVAGAAGVGVAGKEVFRGARGGNWTVDSIEPSSYDRVFSTDRDLVEGRWLRSGEEGSIVLGAALRGQGATKLPKSLSVLQGVEVGDTVDVQLTDGRSHDFRVVGIFDDEFRAADSKAYVTEASATKLLPAAERRIGEIFVKAGVGVGDATLRSEIAPISNRVRLESSEELEEPIHEQLGSYKLISDVLRLASAIVAAITIFMVTYVDLVNRRRQIGIERAIGIRRAAIVGCYCLKAIAYAALGIALGSLLFGEVVVPLVAAHPFHFPSGPVALSPSAREMARDALLVVLVAVLAALAPAYRSVRLAILDAIWG